MSDTSFVPASTSASPFATQELACPSHGILKGLTCEQCGKKPYNVSNWDDLSTLKSLRKVHVSDQATKAGLYGFSLAVLADAIFMLALHIPISSFSLVVLGCLTLLFTALFQVGFYVLRPLPLRMLDRKIRNQNHESKRHR